jgi:hypothetical protein
MKRAKPSGGSVKSAETPVCYVLKKSIVYVPVCAVAYNSAQGAARSFARFLKFKKINMFFNSHLTPPATLLFICGAQLMLKHSRNIHLIDFYCAPRCAEIFIHTA